MTRRPDEHLSLDDLDAWTSRAAGTGIDVHLAACPECAGLARADRLLAGQLASMATFAPAAGLANRVMARVIVPDPFALRSLTAARRRLLGSRRAIGIAAVIALLLAGSMAGSILWSRAHRATLSAAGSWLADTGGTWLWAALRRAAAAVIEQPWYGAIRDAVGSPGRVAGFSALAFLIYGTGLYALRRVMSLPRGRATHANA